MAKVSNDEHVGLHLGKHMPVYKGQVLEYLFLSSPTFGEGLHRALSYQRLLSDAARAELFEEGERVFLRQPFWGRRLAHLNECVMMGLIKFFRFVTDDAFEPLEVHFGHEHHADKAEYERAFGCPVKFGMPSVGVYFDSRLMALPSAHNRLIAELLESGHANLEEVAERLGIKARQLRTRLADAGTNFNQLVADYRCKLAKRLLAGTDESIDEIVYLTGFSEPSTFYRAFKRWVGMTPIEYRKLKAEEDAAEAAAKL